MIGDSLDFSILTEEEILLIHSKKQGMNIPLLCAMIVISVCMQLRCKMCGGGEVIWSIEKGINIGHDQVWLAPAALWDHWSSRGDAIETCTALHTTFPTHVVEQYTRWIQPYSLCPTQSRPLPCPYLTEKTTPVLIVCSFLSCTSQFHQSVDIAQNCPFDFIVTYKYQ